MRLVSRGRRDQQPDAIFHLASVPSTIATELIHSHGYVLVPIPFADAFRLAGALTDDPESGVSVVRRYTSGCEIPPYVYSPAPPIPAEPLPTIGARLVLLAHRDLSPDLVERVVEAVFESRFARIPDPPLHKSLFERGRHAALHDGTKRFLARDRPILAANDVDALANALSVMGALLGAAVFVWQAWRQRARTARRTVFAGFQLEIAELERKLAELELSAHLELESLVELQGAILRSKSDMLTRFAAGELSDEVTLTELLSPLNSARDHVGDLLLHVRENLEQQAAKQGRTAEAMWQEAIEGVDDRE